MALPSWNLCSREGDKPDSKQQSVVMSARKEPSRVLGSRITGDLLQIEWSLRRRHLSQKSPFSSGSQGPSCLTFQISTSSALVRLNITYLLLTMVPQDTSQQSAEGVDFPKYVCSALLYFLPFSLEKQPMSFTCASLEGSFCFSLMESFI